MGGRLGEWTSRDALRLSVLYAAWAIVVGTQMPYLPLWFEARGLTIVDIATVSALPLIVRIVAMPVISFLADKHAAHRQALIATAWLGAGFLLVLGGMRGFWPILIVFVLFAATYSAVLPLTETLASAAARRGALDYGRVRLWASVAFMVISLVGGVIVSRYGPEAALGLMLAGVVLTIAAAHWQRVPDADQAMATSRRVLRVSDAVALVRHPAFVIFLLAGAAAQSSHAALYTYGTLHWLKLGYSTTAVGWFWSVSIIAEVALFAYGATLSRFISPAGLLIAGSLGGALRFGCMAFDPPLALLLPLQALHAISYAASHLGAIQFLSRAVPERSSGTGQALYATMSGATAMAVAVQIAGSVYVQHGSAVYAAMACIAGLGVIAAILLKLRWTGGVLESESSVVRT